MLFFYVHLHEIWQHLDHHPLLTFYVVQYGGRWCAASNGHVWDSSAVLMSNILWSGSFLCCSCTNTEVSEALFRCSYLRRVTPSSHSPLIMMFSRLTTTSHCKLKRKWEKMERFMWWWRALPSTIFVTSQRQIVMEHKFYPCKDLWVLTLQVIFRDQGFKRGIS